VCSVQLRRQQREERAMKQVDELTESWSAEVTGVSCRRKRAPLDIGRE
jgi:hypothetical protein